MTKFKRAVGTDDLAPQAFLSELTFPALHFVMPEFSGTSAALGGMPRANPLAEGRRNHLGD